MTARQMKNTRVIPSQAANSGVHSINSISAIFFAVEKSFGQRSQLSRGRYDNIDRNVRHTQKPSYVIEKTERRREGSRYTAPLQSSEAKRRLNRKSAIHHPTHTFLPVLLFSDCKNSVNSGIFLFFLLLLR